MQQYGQQKPGLCMEAVNEQIGEAWSVPDPVHETPSITGDFNGDGLSDSACLGQGVPGTEDEWRLFVYLAVSDGTGQVIPLPEFSASTPVDWIRIFREPAGEFTTFCGLAPSECEPDALHKIIMPYDGIYLVVLEASSVMIFWDEGAGQFQRQWLSD
jgi:hypothetical protein